MIKFENDKGALRIIYENKIIMDHSKDSPALYIGRGKEDI